MKIQTLLGIFITVIVAAGCEGEQAAIECSSFSSVLAIKDRLDQQARFFSAYEPVIFTLDVTNNSATAEYLFGYSYCGDVHFVVTDGNDQVIWPRTRLACIDAVPPAPTNPNIGPYETVVFGDMLPGGEPVISPHEVIVFDRTVLLSPGVYRVAATADLVTRDSAGTVYSCRGSLSKSASFEIR
jgi:hypothetical protein